jgi:hypothetical protein
MNNGVEENGGGLGIPISTGLIEDSVDLSEEYLTVTQRYYKPYYRVDTDRNRKHDICLLVHSNRVCLVCLAPSHPIITKDLEVVNINCEVSDKVDRKKNKAVGKGKKGGQNLDPTSLLCYVETKCGEKFGVDAIAPSKLICMNSTVLSTPALVKHKSDSTGHIAILLPYKGHIEDCKAGLLDEEAYRAFILKENSTL